MSDYETSVKLPSGGIFYPEYPGLAGDITLRMMKTPDEKKVFGSNSDDVITSLLKSCIINMEFDPDALVVADRHFLLVKLRVHTYGESYHVNGVCPGCGKESEIKINIDDIPIYSLPDDFAEPVEMVLPMAGTKVGLKVLRMSDMKKIRVSAKKMEKEMGISIKEAEYMMKLEKMIVSIAGQVAKAGDSSKLLRDMWARDSAYMKWKLDQIKLGYSDTVDVECPGCGEEYEAPFRLTGEFFHPRFD